MGNTYNIKTNYSFAIFCIVLISITEITKAQDSGKKKLEDIFSSKETISVTNSSKEVEPIVVGRAKWSDPAPNSISPIKPNENEAKQNTKIEELDPLETKQGQASPSVMPLEPPSIPPAVNIHRNFEGKLVLKPRKFGFERDFPYQLENSRGKRLAFIDTQGLRVVDPLSLKDKNVNILGKLEPIKKGSDELVIRARILREID